MVRRANRAEAPPTHRSARLAICCWMNGEILVEHDRVPQKSRNVLLTCSGSADHKPRMTRSVRTHDLRCRSATPATYARERPGPVTRQFQKQTLGRGCSPRPTRVSGVSAIPPAGTAPRGCQGSGPATAHTQRWRPECCRVRPLLRRASFSRRATTDRAPT
jgi:hypothetical protein